MIFPAPRALLLLGLVLAFAALIALRAGQEAAALSETDAIGAVARVYEDRAGAPGHCAGRPGRAPVWLVVTCEGAAGEIRWQVDRLGRLIAQEEQRRPEA